MKKTLVIYWSGTGNTETMAQAVLEGMEAAGAEARSLTPDEVNAAELAELDAIAFGCPAMGAEQLEESEFEPMFAALEGSLNGKKIALFGSYGWGDGQWMRDWVDRMTSAGATVVDGEGVICMGAPDADATAQCEALGARLASLA